MDAIVSLRRRLFRRNFLLMGLLSLTVLFSLGMYGKSESLLRVTNWLGPRTGYQSEESGHNLAGQRHFQAYPMKLMNDDISDNLIVWGAANKGSKQGIVAHKTDNVLFHVDKKKPIKNKHRAERNGTKIVRKLMKRPPMPLVNGSCERCCYSYTTIERGIVKMHPASKLIENGCQQRLPDAMIFGVKKGGTTTLRDFISYHPDIAFTQKELKFFTSRTEYQKGLEYYKSQMIYSTTKQISMEKTPEYCHYPKVPSMINETLPNTKLIMIMRDPIERAVSDFVHIKVIIAKNCPNITTNSTICYTSSGYFIEDTFEKSVIGPDGKVLASNQLISKGVYVEDFKRYLKYFKRDRILPLDGNRFVSDPYPTVKAVEKFLNIRDHFKRDHFYFDRLKGFFCLNKPIANNCMKHSKGRPHPEINEETLAKLREYYRPYNKELNELMGLDVHWSS
ncbi:heparan sulfate glucosamine 3-O-sulfotransferase 1-like [Asterias amurensis]|uniref:heparan sulfate glucosamine 3-O-sulfotransferase 1-like n=1 Tax=Asterias amurensis TaxID=7602 RepID=UPI003AB74090